MDDLTQLCIVIGVLFTGGGVGLVLWLRGRVQLAGSILYASAMIALVWLLCLVQAWR